MADDTRDDQEAPDPDDGGEAEDAAEPVAPEIAPQVRADLEVIRAADGNGLLRPAAVVAYARAAPGTALHGLFEWDDAAAAEAHRLSQARRVIRSVRVTVAGDQSPRDINLYVSIPTDRLSGGGYRRVDHARAAARYRGQLVEEGLRTIERLETRYAYLPEMRPLFDRLRAAVAEFRAGLGQQAPAA